TNRWRDELGKDKQSALANARPFHFTDALLMRPLHAGEAGYIYVLEEQLLEETQPLPGSNKPARVWRSFYVISELAAPNSGQAHVLRRFWFDRNDQARLAKQQLFDGHTGLVTEVAYSNYKR